MKKMIIFLLLLTSFSAKASHDLIWESIGVLERGVNQLQGNVQALLTSLSTLQAKVSQMPAPIYYQAGKGIAINGTLIEATLSNQHHIGEEYHGGIVFFIDESGQHGLVASKQDVNAKGVQWRNGAGGNKITNARGDGIGAGDTNTRLIVAAQTIDNQGGQFAALIAANFNVLTDGITPCKTPIARELTCYGGWYLPSAFELQLLHNNLHEANLSVFAPEFYWSSTEASVSNAWLQNFATGEITAESKANTIGHVRAISHF